MNLNGHFSMINKRGAIAASVFVAANIVLLSISLAFKLNGGRIWLIPIIVFAVTFLFSIMILMSVLRAGIDIKADMVILPDLDPSKGKQPKFRIGRLMDIQLQNGEGIVLDPEKDSLLGGRVVFFLDDDTTETYYPISITASQYRKIHDGMLKMAEAARAETNSKA